MTKNTHANNNFEKYMDDKMDTLEMYTKAIAKVHGPHHPEIIEVRSIFETMKEKTLNDTPQLSEEFDELRNLTNNYVAPGDTCETTVATYDLLEEADCLYQVK